MKVAIVGSRTFIQYELLKSILDKIDIDLIISVEQINYMKHMGSNHHPKE